MPQPQVKSVYSPYYHQQGATLIVVLIVLLLIILAGAIAVRSSTTDLRLATASQIDSLLFTSAEQPNAMLEQEVQDPASNIMDSTQGMIGYFAGDLGESNTNHKLIFCYRPKDTTQFSIFKSAIYNEAGGKLDKNDDRPFCNVGQNKDYISARNTTMTQMKISGGSAAASSLPVGVPLGIQNAKSFAITVDNMSALPSYSSASDSSINNCFKGSNASERGNIDVAISCLSNNGVPNKAVSQTYIAAYQDKIKGSSGTGASTDTEAGGNEDSGNQAGGNQAGGNGS
ncbi:hypothetical protein [Psychrobacter sp. I-STPA6b]|uniref:hypothetical protein n=1 Tax=Psychrobacter sp. I-STPA6b TaxID=2585718 RepID=UPI001D0C8F1A|nr:hypothetical protein [Psychrobacter sp. I-STPA6b]